MVVGRWGGVFIATRYVYCLSFLYSINTMHLTFKYFNCSLAHGMHGGVDTDAGVVMLWVAVLGVLVDRQTKRGRG